jgi:hypothetical protein
VVELPLPLGEGWGEGLRVSSDYVPHPQPFSQGEKGDPSQKTLRKLGVCLYHTRQLLKDFVTETGAKI